MMRVRLCPRYCGTARGLAIPWHSRIGFSDLKYLRDLPILSAKIFSRFHSRGAFVGRRRPCAALSYSVWFWLSSCPGRGCGETHPSWQGRRSLIVFWHRDSQHQILSPTILMASLLPCATTGAVQ